MPITLAQNPADIELNDHNEVDQILGNPPGWLLRWGVSLVFVAAILFSALAWLIKYPDVIAAEVQILTENPAIRLVPLVSGKLESLLIEDQKQVREGELLAILESPEKYSDILVLEAFLGDLKSIKKPQQYFSVKSPPSQMVLGNLQNQYAALIQKLKDYQYFLQDKSTIKKIQILEGQIKHILALNKSLNKQQQTLEKEVLIAKKNWQRNQQLNKEGIISNVDIERIETTYLQYQRQLEGFETQVINNKMQVEQIQSQILDLQQNLINSQNTKELAIKENIQTLQSQIDIWKKSYLIKSPIKGKANFKDVWSDNQFVNAGKELMTVVPSAGAGKIVAKAMLPIENSGKVQLGQTVNITLNGYPYQEYGILKSEVKQIGLVPGVSNKQEEGKFYIIDLLISDSLKTTYNKTIPFSQEMEGTASIITEDRRIFHRIFDSVLSILKNT